MLAARLLARDLWWDLACAEGAHLRAEGVELAIVLHCMNEHGGGRAPPWRQDASPRSFYSRPHSMPRLLLETQRGHPRAARPCPAASAPTQGGVAFWERRASCASARRPAMADGGLDHHHPRRFKRQYRPLKSGNSPSPWSSRRAPSVSQRGRIRL